MTNKIIIIGVVAILVVGLAYLGTEVKNLRAEIASLRSAPSLQAKQDPPPAPPLQPAHARAKAVPPYNWRGAFSDRWDPYLEMARIQRQMNQLFNERFDGGPWDQGVSVGRAFDLSTDIKDAKDKYVINMDIPGMDKSDINVEVQNNSLLVSGERNKESEEKDADYYTQERSFGYFSQRLPLPADADESGISVDYQKGVLTIQIPKLAKVDTQARKPTKIKVN